MLDASGVGRYSTIQVPFDPVGEQIYVNSLRVTDAKGNEVAAGKTSDYYVIDGARGQRTTQAKMLNIPVPGLQPGHTIELVLTRRDLSPPAEFPYTSFVFSSDVPVLSASFISGSRRSRRALSGVARRENDARRKRIHLVDRTTAGLSPGTLAAAT